MTRFKLGIGLLILVTVVCVAAHDGGPRRMSNPRLSDLFGADPAPPGGGGGKTMSDCNGNSLTEVECPPLKGSPTVLCGKEKFDDITPVLKGVLKKKVFDNDETKPVCRVDPSCGKLFSKKQLEEDCTPVKQE